MKKRVKNKTFFKIIFILFYIINPFELFLDFYYDEQIEHNIIYDKERKFEQYSNIIHQLIVCWFLIKKT